MYIPDRLRLDEAAGLDLVERARLGVLVTAGPKGLFASHAPFLIDRKRRRLLAHLARANAHREHAGEGEAMVIFSGPDAYISPSFYASKAEHGRVVPTWNYEAVHVHGRLEWFDDPAELLEVVRALSDAREAGRSEPWSVDDAPTSYIQALVRGVVGVRLSITRVEAKAKLGQTLSPADHAGVVAALAASPDPLDRAVAQRMRPDGEPSA